MNLNLNLSDASGGSSHVSTFGPCCVPSPPWESEVKRSQFLLMSSVTSSNMNKMGIEIEIIKRRRDRNHSQMIELQTLELKNTINEVENATEGISCRINQLGEESVNYNKGTVILPGQRVTKRKEGKSEESLYNV